MDEQAHSPSPYLTGLALGALALLLAAGFAVAPITTGVTAGLLGGAVGCAWAAGGGR